MRLYLDSSALAKRYVLERGSDAVLDRCRAATEIGLSVLSTAEVVSCFNRLRREGALKAGDYRKRDHGPPVPDARGSLPPPAAHGECRYVTAFAAARIGRLL